VLTVTNPTDTAVDLVASYFESNMLRLQAVEKESKRSLRTLVPLLSPGAAPLRIQAKETFVREFDLRRPKKKPTEGSPWASWCYPSVQSGRGTA